MATCAICPDPATKRAFGCPVCDFHYENGEDESCHRCGRGPVIGFIGERRCCKACFGGAITGHLRGHRVLREPERAPELPIKRDEQLDRIEHKVDAIASLAMPTVDIDALTNALIGRLLWEWHQSGFTDVANFLSTNGRGFVTEILRMNLTIQQ